MQILRHGSGWLFLVLSVTYCTGTIGLNARGQDPTQVPDKLKTPPTAADQLKTPPQTDTKSAPTVPQQPTTQPVLPSNATAAAQPGAGSFSGLGRVGLTTPYRMLGDQGPLGIPALAFGSRGTPGFAAGPGQVAGTIFVPSIRGFKIAENESVEPQDRVSVSFNYFENLNASVNERFGADLKNIRVYREFFGVEKTFFNESASFGLRLPLNSISAESGIPGLGGSSTDLGDLSMILKYRFAMNEETGDLMSVGLVVSVPTGPDSFAGFSQIDFIHGTYLQPFLGYKLVWEKVYLHGFFAVEAPMTSRDVTIMYNDIGLGYVLYRAQENDDRFLTAVVPTFEVHVNTPLNHRGAFSPTDFAGTPDVVNLTLGTSFEFMRRASLATGVVSPVTGPKPFDFELLAQFNLRF